MSSSLKTPPAQRIRDLLTSQSVIGALDSFTADAEFITRQQIDICSIPASPFQEQQRAEYLRERFLEHGLSEVEIDPEGNVTGLLQGSLTKPLMVVSAHLDTVFAPGTDFTIKSVDHKLLAPGISDDGCGLVALVALARAFQKHDLKTAGSVLFVGTVGEEGEGNLRGVRYLLTKGRWAKHVDAFLSFDGPGVDRITNRALGSRRYRVELRGSGGHSWGDFGVPNPVHALGRAIALLSAYPIPEEPRTTFNVGLIQGGTSINAIPTTASMRHFVHLFDRNVLYCLSKNESVLIANRNIGVRRWPIHDVDDRGANCGRNMHRASVIGNKHRQPGLSGSQLGNRESTKKDSR